jgi:hypothetical protein
MLAPRGLISPTAACAAVPRRDHLAAMPTALRRSTTWGFAIYRASHEDYQDSILPSGYPRRHPAKSPGLRLRPLAPRHHRLAHQPPPAN